MSTGFCQPSKDDTELEAALSQANRTSLMIAYERSLEKELFQDDLAVALAGRRGAQYSEEMKGMASAFGFTDWPEFHQVWTVVRTRFIDDWICATVKASQQEYQLVNLGAGLDTRAFRMSCLGESPSSTALWEVDLPAVNDVKADILSRLKPQALCSRHVVPCDLATQSLREPLVAAAYNVEVPTHWLLEGLIMYLPLDAQRTLLERVSALSRPGSTAMINFLEALQEEHKDKALGAASIKALLEPHGWSVSIHRYGDDSLNFGRYTFTGEPLCAFSFAVCTKT